MTEPQIHNRKNSILLRHFMGRRSSPRFEFAPHKAPERAEIILHNDQIIPIELVNFSKSGILFYIKEQTALNVNQVIPQLRIYFRNRPCITFQGNVVRSTKSGSRLFCAVQFIEKRRAARKEDVKQKNVREAYSEQERYCLTLLRNVPNYMQLSDVKLLNKAQSEAYNAYDKISLNFGVEERWLFFDMLDELKSKEPNYPKGLLREFIQICEYGFPQNPQPLTRDHSLKSRAQHRLKSFFSFPFWSVLERYIYSRFSSILGRLRIRRLL